MSLRFELLSCPGYKFEGKVHSVDIPLPLSRLSLPSQPLPRSALCSSQKLLDQGRARVPPGPSLKGRWKRDTSCAEMGGDALVLVSSRWMLLGVLQHLVSISAKMVIIICTHSAIPDIHRSVSSHLGATYILGLSKSSFPWEFSLQTTGLC